MQRGARGGQGFRGGNGGGGGGFNGRGRGGRGGMQRTDINGVPPIPQTPLADPLYLPFPRLHPKNDRNTMTLDEELLRAIISHFTVAATGMLDFNRIAEKLKQENPLLMKALYDSDEFLWAYIRCYPEQFAVDQDPRFPWNVYYLSKCKIVAKADRARYNREFAAGNIRIPPDPEHAYDKLKYDVELERRAVAYLYAVFYQVQQEKRTEVYSLDVKKLVRFFKPSNGIPKEVCDYIGEMEDYLFKRFHWFNVFGGQISIRPIAFPEAMRKMTLTLKRNGNVCSIEQFYEEIRESGDPPFHMVNLDPYCSFNDFLMFLNAHKTLFRLMPRENRIRLRHDVVPELTYEEITAIPKFKQLESIYIDESEAVAGNEGPTPSAAAANRAVAKKSYPPGDRWTDDEGDDDDYTDSLYKDYASEREECAYAFAVPTATASGGGTGPNLGHGNRNDFTSSALRKYFNEGNQRMEQVHEQVDSGHYRNGTFGQSGVAFAGQGRGDGGFGYNHGQPNGGNGYHGFQSINEPMNNIVPPPSAPIPPMPRRGATGGARPPRASVRCRPPMPGRQAGDYDGDAVLNELLPRSDPAYASAYQHLEEELGDD